MTETEGKKILLAHGGGGRLTNKLIAILIETPSTLHGATGNYLKLLTIVGSAVKNNRTLKLTITISKANNLILIIIKTLSFQ